MTLLLLPALVLALSCRKLENGPGETIRFKVVNYSGKDGMVETTGIGDFLLSAYRAAGDAEFCLNRTAVRSGDANELPGYYWPLDGALDFYASFPPARGQDISYDASCGEVRTEYSGLDGSQDYVGAYAYGISGQAAVKLEFRHLLSDFSQLQLTASHPDASVDVVSVRIRLPESATYGFESDSWFGTGNCTERVFCPADKLCDYSLVPGTYTLTVEYDVCLYGTRKRFCKSADITFRQGFRTRVSGIIENDMSLSSLNVSTMPWAYGHTYSYSLQDVTPTFDVTPDLWIDMGWGDISFMNRMLNIGADGASYPELRVSCYVNGSQTANYMYDEAFHPASGGVYVSEHAFPCLPEGVQFSYYAYSPCSTGNIRLSPRDCPGVPYLDYTATPGSCQDLLIGCSEGENLRLRHALSQINVYADTHSNIVGSVFSLSFKGICSKGRIPLDGSDATVSSPADFSVSGNENSFFMLPQTLGEDCKLRVGVRVDGANCYYECNISGDVWKAGQTENYILSFTPETLNFRKL